LEEHGRKNAVAVKYGSKASDLTLWTDNISVTRKKLPGFRVCLLSEIKGALKYACKDDYFAVGEHIVKRQHGWPQGGSFSEPATMIDLGTDSIGFAMSFEVRASVGLQHGNLEADQILAGIVHVDDGLFGSYIYCSACISTGLQKLWPDDVGVNLGPVTHTMQHLRSYLLPHFISYDALASGYISRASDATASLLAEFLVRGWPIMMISKVLCAIPRSRGSMFLRSLRLLGVFCKKVDKTTDCNDVGYEGITQWFGILLQHLEEPYPFIERW